MAEPQITLTLEMPPGERSESMRGITRDLYRDLRENVDADVELAQEEPAPGEKGEPITLGLIVLTLISSGAVPAIVESLRKAFGRNSDLTFKAKGPDGEPVEISATNISSKATEAALERLTSHRS